MPRKRSNALTHTSANVGAGQRKPTLKEADSDGYRLDGSMRAIPNLEARSYRVMARGI